MFSTKNRLALAAAGCLMVGGSALATASPAAATTYTETYGCPGKTSGTTWYGDCDGVWWHNNTLRRTLRLYFKAVVNNSSGGNNHTPIDYLSSLDGSKKDLQFYCVNEKYGIKSYVGSMSLGGSNPYNKDYGAFGWDPCVGNGTGMMIQAFGYYGGKGMCTTVTVNTNWYPKKEHGQEQTYPSDSPCSE
jgi:hypothetical protein